VGRADISLIAKVGAHKKESRFASIFGVKCWASHGSSSVASGIGKVWYDSHQGLT